MTERPPKILIHETEEELALGAALVFSEIALDCAQSAGRFVAALSGGATPRAMYRLLAEDEHRRYIPWDRTHLFWVDERCVAKDHPESNYGGIQKDLLSHLSIPKTHIHPIPAEVTASEGALRYEKTIRRFFRVEEGNAPVFDLIVLGVGEDGHTASLFPNQPSLKEENRLVLPVRGGIPDIERITMTFPLLNNARRIMILVSGGKKAETVGRLFSDRPEQRCMPIRRIDPSHGKVLWMIDGDAAALISSEANL